MGLSGPFFFDVIKSDKVPRKDYRLLSLLHTSAHFTLSGSVFKAVDGCILGNTQDNFHNAVWGSALN